jgi:hypothetical protein
MSDILVGSGTGVMTAVVWPAYLGVSTDDPGDGWIPQFEPYDDFNYNRGMIVWRPQRNGDVLGAAEVFAPKGRYTHFIFCVGPHAHGMIGKRPMAHPIIFLTPGIIDVNPIRNQDYLPRMPV